jgi:hypothetical protein
VQDERVGQQGVRRAHQRDGRSRTFSRQRNHLSQFLRAA